MLDFRSFDKQLSALGKWDDTRKRLHGLKVKLDFHLLNDRSNWKPRHMKPPKTPDFIELLQYCSENAMSLFPGRQCGRLRLSFLKNKGIFT